MRTVDKHPMHPAIFGAINPIFPKYVAALTYDERTAKFASKTQNPTACRRAVENAKVYPNDVQGFAKIAKIALGGPEAARVYCRGALKQLWQTRVGDKTVQQLVEEALVQS